MHSRGIFVCFTESVHDSACTGHARTMRALDDVERDIGDVRDKIRVNEDKLGKATDPEDIRYRRRKDELFNDQLTELLKERNNLGTIPSISCICCQ